MATIVVSGGRCAPVLTGQHDEILRLDYNVPFFHREEAWMPSFDVVSDFDAHEASNGVDQANREVATRFDFKGTGSKFEFDGEVIRLTTQSDFQLRQMLDILRQKLAKRGIDIACLEEFPPEFSGSEARQQVILRKGIDSDLARKLVKLVKASKLKVQTAIQGDKLRITGKKRDDLQSVIALLRDTDVDLPLQYENFRD
jgi:cyclic-di-GMP-binding protein